MQTNISRGGTTATRWFVFNFDIHREKPQ